MICFLVEIVLLVSLYSGGQFVLLSITNYLITAHKGYTVKF